jgi:hypothetical protein
MVEALKMLLSINLKAIVDFKDILNLKKRIRLIDSRTDSSVNKRYFKR